MRRRSLASILLAIAAIGLFTAPSHAEGNGNIQYRVQAGDTLFGLAEKFFVDRNRAYQIQRINRIRNPRKIPVGSTLSIPRSALKYDLVSLRVQSYSGSVNLVVKGKRRPASVGARVGKGTEISTGRNGFVALAGMDGTRITLPTNSRARFDETRRYLINGALDVDFKILKGRGSIRAPKMRSNGQFRVGTPVAVTAVRGTEFRVAHNPETGNATTEVVEGEVQVSSQGEDVGTTAGYGVPITPEGLLPVEKLLSAPVLEGVGRIQTGPVVAFTIEKVRGAQAYRTQIARDAEFKDIIAETFGDGLTPEFAQIEEGRLFVRSRAVSQNGVEGLSQGYAFRHKRLGANASANRNDRKTLRFRWQTVGEGPAYQAFQLWRKGDNDTLIVDEVGLFDQGVEISDLQPGDYAWRVGTFQIDEGEVLKVWESVQMLTITG